MDTNIELLYIASLGEKCAVKDLGKKKFQKLVYLIETIGHVDLGYSYQIYLYGPFSKSLDDDLRQLSSLNSIDYTYENHSYLLHITPKGKVELELQSADEMNFDFAHIEETFKQFCTRTAGDLELLTTSCFVCNKLGMTTPFDELNNCVQRIKGSKFKKDLIEESVNEALALMRQ